ncbi:variable surface protein [Plasmodium gonderi]|uniref:Variable surface protein n=1 Tax=Plasmodium gonderi TaxID=77519 RepID=A0A1Y1JQ49_PLAGO|nr:variable surface protein [Plasmodium gonderi]GAW84549.1 variable surface protein [Plasmodium gonderi]
MEGSIYTLVDEFHECNKIIEKYKNFDPNNQHVSKCMEIETNYSGPKVIPFMKMCYQAISYLIEVKIRRDKISNEAYYKYLYYWIYYENKKFGDKTYTKQIYYSILKKFHESIQTTFIKSEEVITDSILEKLQYVYDMNSILYDIKWDVTYCNKDRCACAKKCADIYMSQIDECKFNSESDFCNALKTIRDKFILLNLPYNCEINLPEILSHSEFQKKVIHSPKTYNIRIAFLTTVILTLLTTIILYIFYRVIEIFKKFSISLRRSTLSNRSLCNNIDNEFNIFQASEKIISLSTNNRHNMLYYSS